MDNLWLRYTIAQERPDIVRANYEAKIQNSAFYLQYDFEPFQNLRISSGLRYDRMSFDYENFLDESEGNKAYSQVTPKIGLTYDLGNDKGLYANYSQGFAPPSLTSIFRLRPGTNNEFYYNLKPARFQNFEIGGWAAFWDNKIYMDIALYRMTGSNELLSIRQPDGSTDYQSAGETLHEGIELGLTFKPVPELFFRWGGTVSLHRFEDFQISDREADEVQNLDGFDMPGAPRWVWNTELSYYPKWFKNFRTSLEWQYVSGWYENQINTVKYEGYHLINFRTGYQWKGIELYMNILNLGDALYANRSSRSNNGSRLRFTPAAPRTFVFGIQYNFTGKK